MYLAGRWADRQLSRLELVIAVIILGLILSVFVQHMLKMFAIAERSLLATSVININTAMQYQAAGYALRGDYTSLEAMRGMNPFIVVSADPGWPDSEIGPVISPQMLAAMVDISVPGNYLGELENADPAVVEGGHWYFNNSDRTLVYRVDNTEYFLSSLSGPPRAVFFVDIEYEDKNNNNQFNPLIDEYRTVRLKAVNGFSWQF